MATGSVWLLSAAACTVLVGPLLLGLVGMMAGRCPGSASTAAAGWRTTVRSALLYTVAFNLTFFIQELFLVLPKALTPGLRPTLYHNNHSWEGTSPLASLFQGTGALATLLMGLLCLWWLRRTASRPGGHRLFVFWMAYCGCFMALPQVVIGALSPGSDLGMAMGYLQLGEAARLGAGLVALLVMPLIALRLCRSAPALAITPAQADDPCRRTRRVFWTVTLPALIGTVLAIPFRVPREWLEVLLVPVLVVLPGIPWIQAAAWRVRATRAEETRPETSLVFPLAAAVLLLLLFQLVLRPGIRFY